MFKLKTVILSLAVLSVSCINEHDIGISCADPIGSEDYVTADESWMCFLPDINGCFRIELQTTPQIRSVYYDDHIYGWIKDVGIKNCLSEITEKPLDEFSYLLPLVEHHGYVVRFPDNSIGRFYIDSFDTDSFGHVTRVNIIRQHNY
ncbi:MAG TPA: hypothetical protein VD927_14650 [Chryseosolibacter sp.]|nr:hypothetical protein [Chryseosolibacter sp.]